MQEHCVVVPILPGRGEAARDFMRELMESRRAEQERSEQRVGIAGEAWFLGRAADRELLIGMVDSDDLDRSLELLAVSLDPHDLWFKRRFAQATGVDLNDPLAIDAALPLARSRTALREPAPRTAQAAAPMRMIAGSVASGSPTT